MELTTIDTNNYAAMAKAMGILNEGETKKSSSTLARLRINHNPVMGAADVNGKKVNMEVVEGGTYKLEIPDGPTYYANSVKIRPYLQRFMYKRFIKGSDKSPNRYVKTVMADNLNIDLKDNDGGFNCGKPAGYIKDFAALPKKTQDLIKEIKRVRVILGTVELINPVNDKGEDVTIDDTAFIWEIDNRDAFKIVGESFSKLSKMQRLPIQHNITANTEERKLPNGNSFFLPVVSLDVSAVLNIEENEHKMFADFIAWVDNYNTYIINTWSEKTNAKMEEEDVNIVDNIVDVEIDDEVA
ncbi:MAG: hypothetical protein CBB97_23505 [Candidatus Endolissoclinum sp. TMED37]|nr:MAG: hypothetical protein CBB97_23505 [Candidatus Endolissoclinum sp. TMED37]|tara:strand:- start:4 stop:897 length:894 start_codon:yes stop_codon:yes gene_type:complete